jgi:hypothetical protein
MRRPVLAPWILVGTLTFGTVAHAGCCDDAWSCIAAVATAGVSCQVQGLINLVKTLNDTVSNLFNDLKTRTADIISDARHAVEQASADVKGIREKALSDINDAVNTSHAIVSPRLAAMAPIAKVSSLNSAAATRAAPALTTKANLPTATGAMAAPPTPADPNAVKTALTQADAYVRELKDKSTAVSKDGSNAEALALQAVARHVVLAQRIALDTALEPLRMLGDSLLDLLNHPERIFDPSAQIEADLRRIGDEIPAMLDRIGNEVAQEASADLDQARGPAQQLQDQAAVAASTVNAMQKLVDTKTQKDLDALNGLLPAVSKQTVAVKHGVVLPAGIAGRHELLASAVGRLQVAKMPVIAKHRATVSNIVSQWAQVKLQANARIKIDATLTQKADVNLQQMLGKGSKADIEKRKQQLLEEAKRRYAKDPKTLQKVQAYIQTHAQG